jgi:hypothetical protein
MNNRSKKAIGPLPHEEALLKNQLQPILNSKLLDAQRIFIKNIIVEMGIDGLECAAALLYLSQNSSLPSFSPVQKINPQPGLKMVRYRLNVGSQHQVTLEDLKKILVEESGVDKDNIANVNIRDLYTLLELPDAMPADIFQHLKSVEINQHKLDIKRVKIRNNKKHNKANSRRGRQLNIKPDNETSCQAVG